MDNPSAHDVRLIYLAAAHILKHRGHFLSNISTEDGSQSFEELFNQFAQTWNEYTEKTIVLSEEEKRELKEILLDRGKTENGKAEVDFTAAVYKRQTDKRNGSFAYGSVCLAGKII